MCSSRNCLGLSILFLCGLPLVAAQSDLCGDVQPTANACSFTALNGNCTLTIDRLRPVTPPLIYARHGSVITIRILHPSPFEDLTLDLSSATAQVPADAFSTIFPQIASIAGKISGIRIDSSVNKGLTDEKPISKVERISRDQQILLDALRSAFAKTAGALTDIQAAIQPPPGNLCFGEKGDAKSEAWLHMDTWKKKVEDGLNLKITMPDDTKAANKTIQALGIRIAALGTNDATQDEVAQLNDNQELLKEAVAALENLFKHRNQLTRLRRVIEDIHGPKESYNYMISDFQSTMGTGGRSVLISQNDLNEKWNLDFANTLSARVKTAMADPPIDPGTTALTDLTSTPPAKQIVVTIPILFQTPPHIEVSTGLMVPMLPYHSYTSAAAATNGTVTGYVVQESLTYTVVPVVQMNIVAKDWVMRQRRAALFGTVAVGYNPTTSNVEFGVGPSFSWRTIVLSGLLDIGRDTKLAGGFTVGESLGTSSSVKPLTSAEWSMKPAIGISVRIPLGGSSGK